MNDIIDELQKKISLLHAENNVIAELCGLQSAAARLMIKPETPYPRKPAAPVEEVLQLQIAARMLARRVLEAQHGQGYNELVEPTDVERLLAEALAEAQKVLPIAYLERKEPT